MSHTSLVLNGEPQPASPDFFISYAHDDDGVPPDGGKGFVTYVHERLAFNFRDMGPTRPLPWRDLNRIAGAEPFWSEILDSLEKTPFLLVVLSPNWMASEYCQKEYDAFVRLRRDEGLEDKEIERRLIVVSKAWVEPDDRPQFLQDQTGYTFFERIGQPGDIRRYRPFYDGKVMDERCNELLQDLAEYLVRRKKDYKRPRLQEQPIESGRTIFLARPASDMHSAYMRLYQELTDQGHLVVPNWVHIFPDDASAVTFIDEAVQQAEFSVHLLGERKGHAPECLPPLAELQLQRAAKQRETRDPQFRRLIWAPKTFESIVELPSGAVKKQVLERDPVDVVSRFGCAAGDNDKVRGENLTRFVEFVLQEPPRPQPRRRIEAGKPGKASRIYLCHWPKDIQHAEELAKKLRESMVHKNLGALQTLLPLEDESDPEIKKRHHNDQLRRCDAVAICVATATDAWIYSNFEELDWRKLGRTEEFRYRALVATPPPSDRKRKDNLESRFPDIDFVVDLSDEGASVAKLLDPLFPVSQHPGP